MCNKGFSELVMAEVPWGSGAPSEGCWGFPVKMKSSLICSKMSQLEKAFSVDAVTSFSLTCITSLQAVSTFLEVNQ